jgi:phosphatidylglycerophosphate synthase
VLDRHLRPLIDPALNGTARLLAARRVSPDALSVLGMILGILAGATVALGWPLAALPLILASRLADGLDGAVARATGGGSDFGGYLDIVADFVFYAAIPLGFVLADPAQNGAAGAFLLAAFYINGASFLGFATLAEKHRLRSESNGRKAFFHATGLLEGTETIALFAVICLMPSGFVPLAWVFGALCLLTATLRLIEARSRF